MNAEVFPREEQRGQFLSRLFLCYINTIIIKYVTAIDWVSVRYLELVYGNEIKLQKINFRFLS